MSRSPKWAHAACCSVSPDRFETQRECGQYFVSFYQGEVAQFGGRQKPVARDASVGDDSIASCVNNLAMRLVGVLKGGNAICSGINRHFECIRADAFENFGQVFGEDINYA